MRRTRNLATRIARRGRPIIEPVDPRDYECEDCKRERESRESSVGRASSSEALNQALFFGHFTCTKCGTWIGKPHFQLRVLHGRVAEPLDAHSFEMKPSLWSNLPLECLHIVLASLPLGSRVRFSIVCKAWQCLLASSDFKRLCDSVEPPPSPPVCSLKYQLGKLPRWNGGQYEMKRLELLEVGLSFIPPKFQAFESQDFVVKEGLVCIFKLERQKLEKPKVETHYSYGARAGDGHGHGHGDEVEEEEGEEEVRDEEKEDDEEEEVRVMTAENDDNCKKAVGMSFCVANPIMRTFRELPAEFGMEADFHEYPASWKVQLEVEETGHFTVIVLCKRNGKPTVSIYRSKDNSWKATALTQPLWFLEGLPNGYQYKDWPQYFLCNGELCSALYNNRMNIHCLQSGQVIWDGNRGNRNSDHGRPRVPRVVRKFFGWKGTIYCLEQDCHLRNLVDFGVWKLERSPYMWRKVSFLPEHLQKEVLGALRYRQPARNRRITLEGATLLGDTLYFTVNVATGIVIDPEDGHCTGCMVGYNFCDNAWYLTKCESTFDWSNPCRLFRPNDSCV